ncbi:MAG: hypothetical protein ACHQET_05185 [Chitinophagales bacterium]
MKTLRICQNGHKYYKSSDYPVCPIGEAERKSKGSLFSQLGAPARRALENNGIKTELDLANFSEKEVLKFHGLGPGSIPKLRKLLKDKKLSFRKN